MISIGVKTLALHVADPNSIPICYFLILFLAENNQEFTMNKESGITSENQRCDAKLI